jgi:hypothetical protein
MSHPLKQIIWTNYARARAGQWTRPPPRPDGRRPSPDDSQQPPAFRCNPLRLEWARLCGCQAGEIIRMICCRASGGRQSPGNPRQTCRTGNPPGFHTEGSLASGSCAPGGRGPAFSGPSRRRVCQQRLGPISCRSGCGSGSGGKITRPGGLAPGWIHLDPGGQVHGMPGKRSSYSASRSSG